MKGIEVPAGSIASQASDLRDQVRVVSLRITDRADVPRSIERIGVELFGLGSESGTRTRPNGYLDLLVPLEASAIGLRLPGGAIRTTRLPTPDERRTVRL